MDLDSVDTSDRKLILALDFGTTFSGASFAETRRPGKVSSITSWPISERDREPESSDKCPTLLRYTDEGTQWGFSISPTAPDHQSAAWFKLDLDPEYSPPDRSRSRDKARKGRSAEELVSDHLERLSEHFLYMLCKKLGDGIVDTVPLNWILTVPACFSDRSRERMPLAAAKAPAIKDCPLHVVSEPEVAELFTLQQLDPHGLRVGDTFVTVDAGGGTVDLISYTITKLRPVLEIEEAAPGTGGYCGGHF